MFLLRILRFSFKCEQFISDNMLIIVTSDNFPQDAAATVSTMEAAGVDGTIQRCREIFF